MFIQEIIVYKNIPMIVRVDSRIIILKKWLTFYEVPCYQICRNTYL